MNNTTRSFLSILVLVLHYVVNISFLALHILTVVLAFKSGGIIYSILALAFPVLSEIIFFFVCGFTRGFASFYCIVVWIFLASLIIGTPLYLYLSRKND